MKEIIDITPSSSVYATYSRLSYQPWTALAEFIDNSTQSFFDHEDQLLRECRQDHVEISIEEPGSDILTITDNAYGMEFDDFKRAIVLDKPPADTSGRNEYGMGLKTAACWFGRKWTVITTRYGSTRGYRATMDVEKFAVDKDTYVEAEIFDAPAKSHYTVIRIEKLNKKIVGRTSIKVKDFLCSIYRQDIRRKKVRIIYKNSLLTFVDPEIYEERLEDGTTQEWRKDVRFDVRYEDRSLPVHGFIAIRKTGSLRHAGFALLRRGRVIVGGPDKNYRPVELFKHSNSYGYQRLFGELHMDEWPVTQAKDAFDWHNSGLEEAFITELSKYTEEYRRKAENIRLPRHSADIVGKAVDELQSSGFIQNAGASPMPEKGFIEDMPQAGTPDRDKRGGREPIHLQGPKSYQISFVHEGREHEFVFTLDTAAAHKRWLTVFFNPEGDRQEISLNMKHPFFAPFMNDENFGVVMMKLATAMVLAEMDAKGSSENGLVEPSDIRTRMNRMLESMVSKINYEEGVTAGAEIPTGN